jgi:hypothetical protein
LAEAAGIAIGKYDTLSEAQIRTISDYLDSTMVDLRAARFHAEQAAAFRINPPKRRRGRLINAEEGLARLQASSKAAEVSAHAQGDTRE